MKYRKSADLLYQAKKVIPSAAQTYSKGYRCYCEGAAPAFLERGEGGNVYDIDGNRYIDFLLGLGPVTIGYNDQRINEAVIRQMNKGMSFTLSHPLEVELAQKIVEIIPCAQMVKFLKNGSDATTAAVRLARAYTGKGMIACCGYHGFHDWYIGATVNDRGVPQAVAELTRTFSYNDIASLEFLLEEHTGEIAAVILEPIGIELPEPGFLEQIRELCTKNRIVLIFDEVITGFRLALGGAQEYYGIIPDLCTMGKGVANGMPLSFVAGNKEIMSLIDQGAFVSTTFGGETLSMAAALATINLMETEEYFKYTWGLGEKWLENAKQLILEFNYSDFVKTCGLAPHSGLVFSDYNQIPAEDFKSLFIQEIISEGILSLGVNNYCLAHTENDVEKYENAIRHAFNVFSKALDAGHIDHLLKGERFKPVFARH